MTAQSANAAQPVVRLRAVQTSDLDAWFPMMADPEAIQMAAFASPNADDRAAFDARYRRILADATTPVRTVLLQQADGSERVAGSILIWHDEGHAEISYWIDRALWGRGIATAAVAAFLQEIDERPVYGRAAADNLGSLRVLERSGFARLRTEQGFAPARNAVIDEVVFVYPASAAEATHLKQP